MLEDYALGTLYADEMSWMDEHLATCATCQRALEPLMVAAQSLVFAAPDVPVPISGDLWDRIERSLTPADAFTPATDDIGGRFLDLALAGHLDPARRAVLEGDDLGMSLARTFDEVLRPALIEIGERWTAGSLTVAQEHELTELVRDIVAQLTLRHLPGETTPIAIVAACVAGERHDLGLRMVCGMLRERGIEVHFLGADVEHRFLVEAVQRLAPAAVLLSVSLDEHLPALEEALQALSGASLTPRPVIFVGGNALASRTHVPGHDTVQVLGAAGTAEVAELVLSAAGAEGDKGTGCLPQQR
jgi:methanogenic corrinoid protein MtbC1